jgi:hypothetical protein
VYAAGPQVFRGVVLIGRFARIDSSGEKWDRELCNYVLLGGGVAKIRAVKCISVPGDGCLRRYIPTVKGFKKADCLGRCLQRGRSPLWWGGGGHLDLLGT